MYWISRILRITLLRISQLNTLLHITAKSGLGETLEQPQDAGNFFKSLDAVGSHPGA